MDWRNPLQKLTKEWLAIPAWFTYTLLDLRIAERRKSDGHLSTKLYFISDATTPFHNSAFSLQFCFPFFISLQIKPIEYGRYFQFYIGWRPNGWLGAKLRLTTYDAEVQYNPGVAKGWEEGWSSCCVGYWDIKSEQ